MHKNALFLLKNNKNRPALKVPRPLSSGGGASPADPRWPPAVGCSAPRPPPTIPRWEILATPLYSLNTLFRVLWEGGVHFSGLR